MRRQSLVCALLLALFAGGALLPGAARGDELPVVTGDRLNVKVAGEPELTRIYTVDPDGTIFLEHVGKVEVKGLTPAQARDALAKAVSKIVRQPQVTVEFEQRAQITVGFTGQVGKPGAVTLKKGSRLLDGLAQAQGIVDTVMEGVIVAEADRQNVRLQRRGEPQPRILDLGRILEKDGAANVELQDGDAIFVPALPINVVRVQGAVNQAAQIRRKDGVTLLDAVLQAGGVTAEADRRRVQILRHGANAPETVNLEDVISGRVAQPVLKDGDVVTVLAFARIKVKVHGSVMKADELQLKEGATVMEAVTAAGGFAMDADRLQVTLTTPAGETKKLNLEKLDNPEAKLVLQDGAQVFVPQLVPRRFAVAGGVVNPAVYPFPANPAEKVFLTDAIAQAGGPVERAKKKEIVLVRRSASGGQPQVIPIDFEALTGTRKKKPDPSLNLELQDKDTIYIDVEPERSRRPSTIQRILGIAGAFFGL